MDSLIVGHGSIGARHAKLLSGLGCNVSVASRRKINKHCYSTLGEALDRSTFEYVVICNETSEHYNSFCELVDRGFDGKVLIEKPLFNRYYKLPNIDKGKYYVAYNLRFHPIIAKVKEFIADKQIYSVQAYVGQYLPLWRPGTDYTESYSAKRSKGGGVLRDLSHELDYISWFTGNWRKITAVGGKHSNLRIDSDDNNALLLETEKCPVVSVQLNYLDREGRRDFVINLDEHSLKADLMNNTLSINGVMTKFSVDLNTSYLSQHNAIINAKDQNVCSLDQGIEIVKMIEAVEQSIHSNKWIER